MPNLAWIVAATAAFPNVYVVDDDGGPGVDFLDLPAAAAFAQEGDTILVAPGVYTAFSLAGKSVSVFGPGAGQALVFGPTVVGGATPSGDATRVFGLTFVGDGLSPAVASTPAGVASFTDCEFLGGPGRDALLVQASTVFVDRGFLFGGPAPTAAGFGARVAAGGTLALTSSVCLGGDGLSSPFGFGFGGSALVVESGVASVRRSSLFGGGVPIASGLSGVAGDGLVVGGGGFARAVGDGADVIAGGAAYGAGVPFLATTPGAGIRTTAPGAGAVVHGSVLVLGGEGVVAGAGPPVAGGGVAFDAGDAPRLDLVGDVTASGVMSFVVEGGPPGAPYLLALALRPGFAPESAPFVGDIVIGHPAYVFHIGVLDAFGASSLTGAFGVLAPALIGLPLYGQGLVVDGADWVLTNGVAQVLR